MLITPLLLAPSDFMIPMSRYFSETIIVKIARMLNPATPTIMNSNRFRMLRSISIAARSEPWSCSHVATRAPDCGGKIASSSFATNSLSRS